MSPLDHGQLWVMRIRALIAALAFGLAVAVADFTLLDRAGLTPGVVTVAALVLFTLLALLLPARRYRSWGYRLDEDELHVRHGLWTREHTVVPFGRVQHIDVAQGPLERQFGVGTLVLHTAGTRNSAVALPGLAFDEAGRIRDLIRAKIRQDLL